jgi:hypothetical protein
VARRDRLNGGIDPALAIKLLADDVDDIEASVLKRLDAIDKRMSTNNGLLLGVLCSTTAGAITIAVTVGVGA